MANIAQYETKDGKLRYEFYLYVGQDALTGKGKRVHRRGFRTKKEATLAASRMELASAKSDLANRRPRTFEQVYEEWYSSYINTVRESTYAHTRNMFDTHILPLFGDKQVSNITQPMLQRAVNEWAKIATRNYRRWFNHTARVLDYAVQRGYLDVNPAKRVTIPKQQELPGDELPNFWDRHELARFFGYIDAKDEPKKNALFRVLAFGGLRRGECLALTWGDVDLSQGTVRVNKTLTQGLKGHQIVQAPKTRRGRRTVTIDPKTVQALRYWRIQQMKLFISLGMNANRPDQLVFSTRNNTHMYLNQPEKWLKAIEKAHNIQHTITIHGFRHSHASALFAAGASIPEVQARLGHEDAGTTLNVYTHVTKDQNSETAQMVANYLNF
ncbi:phage-related integrase [Lacticaseibacillus pantheris DSM 15945 = JCM 12539 = NBRC 106106]|uniref:Phage-related integrase n=2 Tax=Lacticaseibacillus pantheris TaxID=171523 RepID=A0A0R1U0R9_9LACO|nr:site-specific integrase [Lacticaseibacillus pantheris]KRL87049.1 phage-related integrase [Lacticaseibacillus pantheris DSM 15945 = JCM 12539 = NBRC 106106]